MGSNSPPRSSATPPCTPARSSSGSLADAFAMRSASLSSGREAPDASAPARPAASPATARRPRAEVCRSTSPTPTTGAGRRLRGPGRCLDEPGQQRRADRRCLRRRHRHCDLPVRHCAWSSEEPRSPPKRCPERRTVVGHPCPVIPTVARDSGRLSGHTSSAQYPRAAKKNMSPPAQTAWLHVWVRSRNHAAIERRKTTAPMASRTTSRPAPA